jgi:hypothetical protein
MKSNSWYSFNIIDQKRKINQAAAKMLFKKPMHTTPVKLLQP